MGAGHSHGTATGAHRSRLLTALLITLTVMGAEVIGGLISGSLALLADAAHMLTDAAGVGLALLAAWFASRPATPERTFGYQRSEVLAAVVNALLLFGVAGFVLVEAVRRFTSPPPEVATGLMLGVAVVGLVANTISLLVLRGGQQESLNVRGAYLEVLGDLLGSAAVIVAAIVIALTGYTQADPIASALIGLMILPRTWGLLREAVDVLLEATPRGVDLTQVRQHLLDTPGVIDVHDLHAWTITSGLPVLSVHVVVAQDVLADGGGGRVLDSLGACLAGHFDVEHCTFQLEEPTHQGHEHAHHD
ncbi:MAG TPA: cation diffusion facilitator family transporter [Dermatophilaceae bacterium]|jgi:cobalt-zinc-cadmium efflux system protein|nr:cation diffusion facilitator family transporter [Dermatophilaceae bacterium]HOF36047.1 cation diffusion facilitator family transporter [Dermatophilaceae bacterium]HOR14634.1 cation diffusion facilitator family transporter [Dermatophilaceae bacterium]HOV01035.1 cation diffusion facilitator family transporter [Dermatophilaceae bacterium]HPK88866.1 cation diffusion facilitator family transporter [Dermatophilaceae bacterium]